MITKAFDNKQYHAHPAVGSSTIKKFGTETPATIHHQILNPDDEEKESTLLGTVAHALILEPETCVEKFVIEESLIADKTRAVRNGGGKEKWESMKETAEILGLPLVKHEIWQTAKAIEAKVRAHPFHPIIKNGMNEISIFTVAHGIWQKARPDCWSPSTKTIIDVKTCRHTLTDRAVQKEILDRGYHVSAAMYLEVARAEGLDAERFVWLFIENFAPYNCRFVEASEKMLKVGREEYMRYLGLYKKCMETGDWYGYGEEVDIIDVPDWYLNRDQKLPGQKEFL